MFSHDAARTTAFARTRGRPVDVLAVFPTRDTWSTLLDSWWMSPSAVPEGFTGTLNVGLPLFPADGSLDAAASGAYDEQWRQMGALIAARYPDAWVRPGWEMNIPNWAWSANPGNVEQYKQAFRRASVALRSGGPSLRVVFNPNEGRGGSLADARDAYPGDAYVDDIGLDAYDWNPGYDAAGWQEHRTKDQGWDFWAEFARAHGKTFSVPEWGVIPGSDTSGGDNPEYVSAVLDWMGAHADLMSFDTYFEEPEPYCRCALSLNPRAQAAYTAKIGELAASGGSAAAVGVRPGGDAATEPGTPQPGAPQPGASQSDTSRPGTSQSGALQSGTAGESGRAYEPNGVGDADAPGRSDHASVPEHSRASAVPAGLAPPARTSSPSPQQPAARRGGAGSEPPVATDVSSGVVVIVLPPAAPR